MVRTKKQKIQMKNLKQVLQVLSLFTYTEIIDAKALRGHLGDDFVEVSYYTELANTYHNLKNMPVQIVIRITLDGVHAMTWGCVSTEENSMFVEWYQKTKGAASTLEFETNRSKEKMAKNTFDNLFKTI